MLTSRRELKGGKETEEGPQFNPARNKRVVVVLLPPQEALTGEVEAGNGWRKITTASNTPSLSFFKFPRFSRTFTRES